MLELDIERVRSENCSLREMFPYVAKNTCFLTWCLLAESNFCCMKFVESCVKGRKNPNQPKDIEKIDAATHVLYENKDENELYNFTYDRNNGQDGISLILF